MECYNIINYNMKKFNNKYSKGKLKEKHCKITALSERVVVLKE